MLPNVAKIAALIGDPVRSRMLFSLLDGTEIAASELAYRAAASPQAASMHLAKLLDGGLICVRSHGRQRFFRLASAQVASAVEALASIAPAEPVKSLRQHTAIGRLRLARSCYDHLAGKLGVNVTEALSKRSFIVSGADHFTVTPSGEKFFAQMGIDLETLRSERRHFARKCLDWTERRDHLAGALGAALLEVFLARRWVARNRSDRSLAVTDEGRRQFLDRFGVTHDL